MEQLSLVGLSDETLVAELRERVRRENEDKAGLLPYIAEVDRRRLYAKQGYSSMFVFCVEEFRMSEPTAVKRIRAARAAQGFPVLFAMIARAEIHLSGLLRLSAHLTAENHLEVLAEAKHKTLKEIDLIVARLAPKPDVRSSVRAVPRERSVATAESLDLFAAAPAAPPASSNAPAARPLEPARSANAPPARSAVAAGAPTLAAGGASSRATRAPDPAPLAPGRYKLAITLGEEGRANLCRLQGLHAHRIPSGDPAAIVELALRTLLQQSLKEKAALTNRPRASRARPGRGDRRSRAIPAAIKRTVWERDGGSCSFVGPDGRRCGEIRCVEYAHLEPWAKGGEHTVDNVALRCRPHNSYEAVRDYGELFMQRKVDEARSTREPIAVYRRLAAGRGERSGAMACLN
jgi:5-methylcytosine-specific restriction endonuclease McrA